MSSAMTNTPVSWQSMVANFSLVLPGCFCDIELGGWPWIQRIAAPLLIAGLVKSVFQVVKPVILFVPIVTKSTGHSGSYLAVRANHNLFLTERSATKETALHCHRKADKLILKSGQFEGFKKSNRVVA